MAGLNDFIDAVKRLTETDTRGLNCYATSLVEGVFYEILGSEAKQGQPSQEEVSIPCISHPLPINNENFRLFPLIFNYHDLGPHHDKNVFFVKGNQSYFMKTIHTLACEIAEGLRKISIKEAIPLSSLACILWGMIGLDCKSVDLPDRIPAAERDNFVVKISKKIYDLLMEAFIIFMMVGFSELQSISTVIDSEEDLSKIRDFLRRSTCCPGMETRLSAVACKNDLIAYRLREFSIFAYIEVARQTYVDFLINKAVQKRSHLCEPIGDMQEENYTLDDNTISQSQKRRHKTWRDPQIGKESEMDTIEEMDFEADIRERVKKYFYTSPFNTYELTGYPPNVLHYIRTIVKNSSIHILEKQSARISTTGKSYRTGRRDKAAFEKGDMRELIEAAGYDPDGIKKYKDVPEEVLERYQEMKDLARKHQRLGRMSRNSLIKYIKDSQNTDGLVNTGIPIERLQTLQKLSETTLKNKIGKLEAAGKVSFEKGTSSHYYKGEDIPSIARTLADQPKRRK